MKRALAVFLVLVFVFCSFNSLFAQERLVPDYFFNQGESLFNKSRYEEAIPYFKKAVQLDPLYLFAYKRLAYAYRELGDNENEARSWKKITDIQLYNKLVEEGQYLEGAGALQKAIDKYKTAYKLIPNADLAKDLLKRISKKLGPDNEGEILPPEQISEVPHPYLDAPLMTSNDSGPHSLVLIPGLEGCRTLPKKQTYVRTGFDFATMNYSSSSSDWNFKWDGTVMNLYTEFRYGLSDDFEFIAKLSGGSLNDKAMTFEYQSTNILTNLSPSFGLDDLTVGFKHRLTGASDDRDGWAVSFLAKLPIADEKNLLSTTSPDLAVNFIKSQLYENVVLNYNVGFVFPGDETLIFDKNLDISPMFTLGAGAVVEMGGDFRFLTQIEGNTNGFDKLAEYSSFVMTAHTGLRYHTARLLFEVSLGVGLTDAAGDFFSAFHIGYGF